MELPKVLKSLKQGLLEKAENMLISANIDPLLIDSISAKQTQKLVIVGRYLALKELHSKFEEMFDSLDGAKDISVSGFQNGVFQHYKAIFSNNRFLSSTGWDQVEGKPKSVILDYGRVIEMVNVADDVEDIINLGASASRIEITP
jgi:hypothetical protein